MSGNNVISDIEQLTPERLTKILKKKGIISDGKVTKIIKKNSRKTTTSMVHFLEIKFYKDARVEPASLKIVVKIMRDIFGMKLEAKFYNIVAETMNKMPIPTCYDAAFSKITGWYHLILEDLSQTYKLFDASSYTTIPLPPPKRYCEMAIDSLAELHAFWWDHQKLRDFSKLSHVLYTFKENSFNEKDILNWFDIQKDFMKQFLNLVGDRLSEKTKEMFNTICSKFPQLVNERLKQGNLTVIHVDPHFWNFFYPKHVENDKNIAYLFDWQTWGIGAGGQDLAYMIGLWLYPEQRNMMEKDLIKRYHNNLGKFGVKNYSWDECWYDYRLFNLLNIYRILCWWSISGWSNGLLTLNNPFWWPQLNRSILNIEDLNCMELFFPGQ